MKQPRHRKDNRRPDLEIYKPGLSRLRNKHAVAKQEASEHDEANGGMAGDTVHSAISSREGAPNSQGLELGSGPHTNGPPEGKAETSAPPGQAVFPENWCPQIIRRVKKPDQQIYQPGKRLQSTSKEPVAQLAVKCPPAKGDRDERDAAKDSGGCSKQVVQEGKEVVLSKEAEKTVRGEKGRKAERADKARKGNTEASQNKLSTPKRYSRSDKRRNRYRTCSTSSAGSNNSTDGARGETEAGKKRQEVAKERLRPQKQLSVSSTDSLEDDRVKVADVRRTGRDTKSWASRGADEKEAQVTAMDQCKRKPSGASLSDSPETGEGKGSSREPQGKGRGILILPANTDLTTSGACSPEATALGPRLLFGGGSSKGTRVRGRGVTTRRLWDPNNPEQKPALKNQVSQLHFLDTDDEVPPVPRNDTRQTQASYYRFQNSDNPYYYGRTGGQGPPYSYAGYSLPYQVGPSTGAYYPAGYRSQAEPYVCSSLLAGPLSPEMEQQVRSLQQQELTKVLREASHLEQQLSNLLSRDRLSPEGLEKMAQLR